MKQFSKIFKFELKNYLTNKIFVGVTLVLVVLIAGAMFFPRVREALRSTEPSASDSPSSSADAATETDEASTMLLVCGEEEKAILKDPFAAAFPDYNIVFSDDDIEEIKRRITAQEADCAFVFDGLTSYTYYIDNLSLYDNNIGIADSVLQNVYQVRAMLNGGMTAQQVQDALSVVIEHEAHSLGKDQAKNFFYTYIMIFALYTVIILYGQMIATNVATEKSSRAMELLITSANPVSMMFGKVLASCCAGLIQLIAIFGSSLIFFHMNQSYWFDNEMVSSLFGIPVNLFVYMLIFFTLGFFIYAFLFGAIGSTASKLEDINTSLMPITLLFVFAFMVVMFSMSSGNVDTLLMKVCSFIPFTSSMAMFTRLAMSTVPMYEVLISIAILMVSVVGIGVVSAKIYRVGVLLYGTPPKLGAILKAIRKS